MNKNYKITDQFNEEQYEQSDFGRVYYNTPRIHESPKTIEELAVLLKYYNDKNEPVTIRNTGHSINGQTLTSGVQIGLENLKWVNFDEEKLEVAVGAGTSWDQMLKAINFPNYSPSVFPNNPGQRIHIGGTAAVGGVGFFSSKYGGFWNTAVEITLVTMEGDIHKCSRTKNIDYFLFSLGGFGRIGVIAEIKIKVVKPKPKVLAASLIFESHKHFLSASKIALGDDAIDSVNLLRSYIPIPFMTEKFLKTHEISFLYEISEDFDIGSKIEHIREKYSHIPLIFQKQIVDKNGENITISSLNPCVFSRRDIVYWYPEDKGETQLDHQQIWSDYSIPSSSVAEFITESEKIMDKYKLDNELVKIQMSFSKLQVGFYNAYSIKNLSEDLHFPLSLDIKGEKISVLFGSFLSVPRGRVREAIELTNELTKLAYELGGKRYLYGYHDLTKEQVEKQFGKDTIEKWQKLKDELDPNHLLNIRVIEHLDD